MKKIILSSLLLIFLIATISAQNPKRYLFLEHFTNTVCSICSTKNPPFFEKISDYPNDIHHISIHPPVPYTTCEFYIENTFENEALAITYGINGTPQVYLWGDYVSSGALLPDATLQAALAQTSPISVIVSESGSTERLVNVSVNAYEDLLNGNDYRLFVAMVEGTVNYDAPNGEGVHHNVFRKLLTPENGIPFETLSAGEIFDFNGSFSVSSNYVESEVYAIAWVQIFETKEVLNSGSSKDAIVNSNEEAWSDHSIQVFPNPTNNQLRVDLNENQVEMIDILNIGGETAMSVDQLDTNNSIDIAHLNSGIYFVRILTKNGIITRKITKL